MANTNVVLLAGTVVLKDGKYQTKEIKTANGMLKKAEFRLRVLTAEKKKEGEQYAPSDFFSCEAFGATAEYLCQYVKGGDKIIVQGRLRDNSWEVDYEDGTKGTQHKVYISVNSVERCSFDDADSSLEDKGTGSAVAKKPVAKKPVAKTPATGTGAGVQQTNRGTAAAPQRRGMASFLDEAEGYDV